MARTNNIKFEMPAEEFDLFMATVATLNKVKKSEFLKIAINPENIFIFVAEYTGQIVNYVHTYTFDKSELFRKFTAPDIEFVLGDVKNVFSKLKFLQTRGEDIKVTVTQDTDNNNAILFMTFEDSMLKIKVAVDDISLHEKIKRITSEAMEDRVDPEKANFNFDVGVSDIQEISKLTKLSTTDIVELNIVEGEIFFSQGGEWSYKVGETSARGNTFIFSKSYINYIACHNETVNFSVFDTFVGVIDGKSKIMIILELI